MIRSLRGGSALLVLAIASLAWGQAGSPTINPSGSGYTLSVQEPGKRAQVCKILKVWAEPEGARGYQVEALDTGERMTVLETSPASGAKDASARTVTTKIFRYGKSPTPPAGMPGPPAHARSLDLSGTVSEKATPATPYSMNQPVVVPTVKAAPLPTTVATPNIVATPQKMATPNTVAAPKTVSTPTIVSSPNVAPSNVQTTTSQKPVQLPATLPAPTVQPTPVTRPVVTAVPAVVAPVTTPATQKVVPENTADWRQSWGRIDQIRTEDQPPRPLTSGELPVSRPRGTDPLGQPGSFSKLPPMIEKARAGTPTLAARATDVPSRTNPPVVTPTSATSVPVSIPIKKEEPRSGLAGLFGWKTTPTKPTPVPTPTPANPVPGTTTPVANRIPVPTTTIPATGPCPTACPTPVPVVNPVPTRHVVIKPKETAQPPLAGAVVTPPMTATPTPTTATPIPVVTPSPVATCPCPPSVPVVKTPVPTPPVVKAPVCPVPVPGVQPTPQPPRLVATPVAPVPTRPVVVTPPVTSPVTPPTKVVEQPKPPTPKPVSPAPVVTTKTVPPVPTTPTTPPALDRWTTSAPPRSPLGSQSILAVNARELREDPKTVQVPGPDGRPVAMLPPANAFVEPRVVEPVPPGAANAFASGGNPRPIPADMMRKDLMPPELVAMMEGRYRPKSGPIAPGVGLQGPPQIQGAVLAQAPQAAPVAMPMPAPVTYPIRQVSGQEALEQQRTLLRDALLPSEREQAADFLGNYEAHRTPMAVEALLGGAKTDPALMVRVACVRALGKMRAATPDVVESLQTMSRAGEEPLRNACVEVLGLLRTGR